MTQPDLFTSPPNPSSPINQQGQIIHGSQYNVGNIIMQTNPWPIPLQRPQRVDNFVNRDQDLTNLLVTLRPGATITLCGPGGIGKTTLAAEAIWRLAPGDTPPVMFPDGIIYHDFYRAHQIDLAFEHIARTFGEETKPTPRAAAQRALAGRRLLLLLDGAEEADNLTSLLTICDRCGVLITSRRHSDAPTDWSDLEPLSTEHALLLLHAWGGPRAQDDRAGHHICELLGGLPLAVRLAGRFLHQQAINASEYLTLLQSTSLAALDHGQRQHESVPHLLARSLDKVSQEAQLVLSVVGSLARSPFTSTIINAALPQLTPITLTIHLGELVNYGLLQRNTQTYTVTHSLIHNYAHTNLTPHNDVIQHLAEHFTTILSTQSSDFALCNFLRPHVITLVQLCSERKRWSTIDRLASAIDQYLDLQGHWTDRITIGELAVTAARRQRQRARESDWLSKLAHTHCNLGHADQAITYAQSALALSRKIGDRYAEGNYLDTLGNAYALQKKLEQAITYYQQALVINQDLGERRQQGINLGHLGNAYAELGQTEEAIAYYTQALLISQEGNDRMAQSNHLGNLGIAYADLGRFEQAITYYQQALTISQEVGHRRGESNHSGNLGLAYAALGQLATAVTYITSALTIAREINNRLAQGIWLANLGEAYTALGWHAEAQQTYQQSLAILQSINHPYTETVRSLLEMLVTQAS